MDFEQAANAIQSQVDLNNSWSAAQAQRQMDFQERMSNTAHQREVADLQAAGLNPVLSASHNGASTPSGAMASGDNSGTSALVEIMSQMAQADNARAIAELKYGSGRSRGSSGSLFGNDVVGSFLEDAVEAATGSSSSELLHNLAVGVGNFIHSGYNTVNNWLSGNTNHYVSQSVDKDDYMLGQQAAAVMDVVQDAAESGKMPAVSRLWNYLVRSSVNQASELNRRSEANRIAREHLHSGKF